MFVARIHKNAVVSDGNISASCQSSLLVSTPLLSVGYRLVPNVDRNTSPILLAGQPYLLDSASSSPTTILRCMAYVQCIVHVMMNRLCPTLGVVLHRVSVSEMDRTMIANNGLSHRALGPAAASSAAQCYSSTELRRQKRALTSLPQTSF